MTPVVFLLDVDNTLLDNDAVQADIRDHLAAEYGPEARDRYWAIFEHIRQHEVGYADYLEALQRYRLEHPHDPKLLAMSSWLVDYPFADRLYPDSLNVIRKLRQRGQVVLLTDGDVVFQPRKVEKSGLKEAVGGHVLIYVHKELELADVKQKYPAEHYVFVDDKLRILNAVKQTWGTRVTTVFCRQGHYALDPAIRAAYPPADRTMESIGEMVNWL